jgi:hypothetical protein
VLRASFPRYRYRLVLEIDRLRVCFEPERLPKDKTGIPSSSADALVADASSLLTPLRLVRRLIRVGHVRGGLVSRVSESPDSLIPVWTKPNSFKVSTSNRAFSGTDVKELHQNPQTLVAGEFFVKTAIRFFSLSETAKFLHGFFHNQNMDLAAVLSERI